MAFLSWSVNQTKLVTPTISALPLIKHILQTYFKPKVLWLDWSSHFSFGSLQSTCTRSSLYMMWLLAWCFCVIPNCRSVCFCLVLVFFWGPVWMPWPASVWGFLPSLSLFVLWWWVVGLLSVEGPFFSAQKLQGDGV